MKLDYMSARDLYIAGRIHSAVAIAAVAKDRTFIAEHALDQRQPVSDMTALEAAREVVLGPWRKRLVASRGGAA